MAIQQKLQTRLAQKLILTPSLQQAIKLLPMSTLELADLLNQEIVENPLLEEIPTEDLQAAGASRPRKRKKRSRSPRTTPGTTRTTNISLANISTTATGPKAPHGSQGAAADREHALDEQLACRSSELAASIQTDDELMRDIGDAIIGNLDDDGYLVASVDEIAAMGPWPSRMSSARSSCCIRSTRSASARAICRSA